MTLVLAAHKRDTVFQVSDRLVSQVSIGRSPKPLDVVTNKSVVYLAKDAIVAISFSGRAFLENRRTDLWVTEKLLGMEFEESGSIVFFMGGSDPMDVFHACEQVRVEAERVFHGLRHERYASHSFMFCGWQRRRKNHVQPFLWRLENTPSTPGRFEMFNLLKDTPDWWRTTSFSPIGTFRRDIMDELLNRLKNARSPRAVEDELVQTVQLTASCLPGVGADCLVVRLHPEGEHNVVIRYVRQDGGSTVNTKTTKGEPRVLPYIFTPWILGDGALMPPNLIVGAAGSCIVGGLACRFDSPQTPDAAGYGSSSHSVEDVRRAIYGPSAR